MNRNMDKQELVHYLSDMKNSQDVLVTAVSAQQIDLQKMMSMMQNVRSPCRTRVLFLTISL